MEINKKYQTFKHILLVRLLFYSCYELEYTLSTIQMNEIILYYFSFLFSSELCNKAELRIRYRNTHTDPYIY